MSKLKRFLTPENAIILIGLLLAQVILFFLMIKDEQPGPLSVLAILIWMGGTAIALIFHVSFFLLSSRKLLFGVALLISIMFWGLAWFSFDYLQRTKTKRDRIEMSDEYIKGEQSGRNQLEDLLNRKNILFKWVPDSLCYRVYRKDNAFYYVKAGTAKGEGITTFETLSNGIKLSDTSAWMKGLENIIPLLDARQLAALHKSMSEKTFCLNHSYHGYSCTYPCWKIVVTQRFDSISSELFTSMHFPW